MLPTTERERWSEGARGERERWSKGERGERDEAKGQEERDGAKEKRRVRDVRSGPDNNEWLAWMVDRQITRASAADSNNARFIRSAYSVGTQ